MFRQLVNFLNKFLLFSFQFTLLTCNLKYISGLLFVMSLIKAILSQLQSGTRRVVLHYISRDREETCAQSGVVRGTAPQDIGYRLLLLVTTLSLLSLAYP